MRPNPVRQKLMAGETSYGVMAFEFFTPGLAPALAAAGAEFILLDMEHSGAGIDTMKAQAAFARGAGLVPMVRVPGIRYHLIAPILDAGAMGIMAPMVETPEQAENLSKWCRYRPEGVRGLAFGIAHDDYAGGEPVAKMAAANGRTLTIALIETAKGIEAVEEILAVPGIDVGWLGHFDLTDSLGITAQFEHKRFHAAVDRFLAACERHRKPPGILATTVEGIEAWRRRGFRCFCYGTDVSLIQAALGDGLKRLRATEQQR
jgi:2-keto-3-deoxy-L-rhamnonate aldolase RhmA